MVYTYLYMRVFPISLYAYEKDQKIKSPKYCLLSFFLYIFLNFQHYMLLITKGKKETFKVISINVNTRNSSDFCIRKYLSINASG